MEYLQVLATRMAAAHRSHVDVAGLRHIVELGGEATRPVTYGPSSI